ncbi:hypothetical protein HYV74_03545 [Candidatus Uhrbacteria bacterium]|nr:hypothetical protein [Candidatus Uhrbacteria bacterium]
MSMLVLDPKITRLPAVTQTNAWYSVVWSPSGAYVAGVQDMKIISCWRGDGSLLWTQDYSRESVQDCVFAGDDTLYVRSIGYFRDGTRRVRIRRCMVPDRRGRNAMVCSRPVSRLGSMAATRDGALLYAEWLGSGLSWHRYSQSCSHPHQSVIREIASCADTLHFSRDGRWLWEVQQSSIQVTCMVTNDTACVANCGASILAVDVADESHRIAVVHRNGRIAVFAHERDPRNGVLRVVRDRPDRRWCRSMRHAAVIWGPGDHLFLLIGQEHRLLLVDADAPDELTVMAEIPQVRQVATISPDPHARRVFVLGSLSTPSASRRREYDYGSALLDFGSPYLGLVAPVHWADASFG